MTDLLTKGYAAFSPCMTYRYDLVRVWDDTLPTFMVIMLNPSTADAEKDDPTTRKCLRYARENGCGRYVAVNLFAFRSPEPKVMKAREDATGGSIAALYILRHLEIARESKGFIVVAWGNDGEHQGQDSAMLEQLWARHFNPLCFGVNEKTGMPKHPTYIANGLSLIRYKRPTA